MLRGTGPGTGTTIPLSVAEAAEKIIREFLLPHIFGLYDVVVNGGQERDTLRAVAGFILACDKDRLRPSDFTSGVRDFAATTSKKMSEWAGRFCAMGWLRHEDEKAIVPKAWLVTPAFASISQNVASRPAPRGQRPTKSLRPAVAEGGMTVSDKSPCAREAGVSSARRAHANNKEHAVDLSVPRTRKEICQTRLPTRPSNGSIAVPRSGRGRRDPKFVLSQPRFGVSIALASRIFLTFLTRGLSEMWRRIAPSPQRRLFGQDLREVSKE